MLLAVVGVLTALYVVFHYFRKSRSIRDIKLEPCAVSNAHFTCDPGTESQGYNTVVALIKFSSRIPGCNIRDQLIDCLISEGSRLCQAMKLDSGRMIWISMGSDWSPRDHIVISDAPTKESSLSGIMGELMSSPVDLLLPCWQIYILESVVDSDSRVNSAVIFKYHHALADGFTMLQNMVLRMRPVDSHKSVESLFPFPRKRPSHNQSFAGIRNLWKVVRSLARIVSQRADSSGPFRASNVRLPNEPILIATGKGVSLSRVRAIAHAASKKHTGERISVNDVISALLTIALRKHCNSVGSAPNDISTVMWVSLQKELKMSAPKLIWDNSNLGFAHCKLPVATVSELDILYRCHNELRKLKQSADAFVINRALRFIGSIPLRFGKPISSLAADKASISLSNLPGPNSPVRWPVNVDKGDDEQWPGVIKEMYFATSPPFHFGPLFSIMSYCDRFYITASARQAILSEPALERIIDTFFNQALLELETQLL